MGFNRIVDNSFDQANPRTSNREIPTGQISSGQAKIFVIIFLIIFVIASGSINILCLYLSPVAIFFVLGYSFTKRFTWMCHFFLGISIGLAPTAAWIAVLEKMDTLPLMWSGGLMLYIAGFDILYSCQDADFDRKSRLHSIPSRFGIKTALWTARLCHLGSLTFFALAGLYIQAGIYYWIGIIITFFLFMTEHILVRPGKLDKINIAFFNVNAIVSTVLLIAVSVDLIIRNQLGGIIQ